MLSFRKRFWCLGWALAVASAAPLGAHPLAWDAMEKTLDAKLGDGVAEFSFAVANSSERPVVIESVHTSCHCTTVDLPPMPWTLAAGASGTISVVVDLRGKEGRITKSIEVASTAGLQTLQVTVNIPEPDVDIRATNQRIAALSRQAVFRGDCATCHVAPLGTKTGQYYLALFLMLAVLLVLYKLESSRLGLIWKSIGMADNLAQSLGVNIANHKLLAFMLGCFFAGVAGAFYAHFIRFLFPPEFGFLMATNILVYNFVGGRGHFAGPIVGATFLSLLSEPFRGSPYETIFFSIAMLLTILFLPGGLITLPEKVAGLRRWGTASPSPRPAA